ncbi:hypothetical protein M8C21_012950 [Ambrosia artemisiifolia]|uniref:Uncharacterized protein n=1 Tax=Ambrosia artemisiifolia TaxID=4212 RepID=A0AAD5GQT8_AMBAR|nr:hypothetical protein M8C21_012950 [Ambrosia artemisiifolia]
MMFPPSFCGHRSFACVDLCFSCSYFTFYGLRCLILGVDLVDVEEFEQGSETIFIRVLDSDLGSAKVVTKATVIVVFVTFVKALTNEYGNKMESIRC